MLKTISMAERRSILLIGVAWFISSAVLSTWANMTFLNFFQDAYLHTFLRFVGAALIGFVSCVVFGSVQVY